MQRKLSPFPFFSTWLIAALALAAPAPYFDAVSIPPTLLTPPPAAGTAAWQAEIALIVGLQRDPDPAALEQAADERRLVPQMLVQPVVPQLTPEDFPLTYRLLRRVNNAANAALGPAKAHFNTQRPYLMSHDVRALVEPDDNPAYPSGHTTASYVWAHVMGLLIPEDRAAFLDRAQEIAQHRVLVGMHFPHDVQGGRELALLVVGALLQSADFHNDLAQARQELAEKCAATAPSPETLVPIPQ